jgi:hypothetical protein
MKVFELLREDVKAVTEEQVVARMKGFNWKYEFLDDPRKVMYGTRELELIENMVYRLWKQDADIAMKVWHENCPSSHGVIPSFIYRLQAQEQ